MDVNTFLANRFFYLVKTYLNRYLKRLVFAPALHINKMLWDKHGILYCFAKTTSYVLCITNICHINEQKMQTFAYKEL